MYGRISLAFSRVTSLDRCNLELIKPAVQWKESGIRDNMAKAVVGGP